MRDAANIREVDQLLAELSTVHGPSSLVHGPSSLVHGPSSLVHGPSYIPLMGFIFWPPSKRYVSERPTYLPEHCQRVGVFVDEDIDQVQRTAADYALDFIQLHGHETPEYLRALCSVCGDSIATIKAFNIATIADLAATKPYEGLADYFLFDTKTQLPGGSGLHFDWNVLDAYDGTTPYLLSGGIGPDDAEILQSSLQRGGAGGGPLAQCVGIDLNSRFELAPALKDVAALRRFLYQLNCKSQIVKL